MKTFLIVNLFLINIVGVLAIINNRKQNKNLEEFLKYLQDILDKN